MRSRVRGLAWVLALLPAIGVAQTDTRDGRMYLSSGLLIGSTRMVGLGGAYVGIGEGASSMTSNLAAIAHRKPTLATGWNVDIALSYLDLPLGNPEARDLDNDGSPDDARVVRNLITGVYVQVRNFGVGGYSRTTYQRYCLLAGCGEDGDVSLTIATTAIAGAVALGDDELLVALGLYSTSGDFQHGTASWTYGNFALTFDALYRPVDRNFRIGLSVKPQVIGGLRSSAPFGEALPFDALATPFVFSLGGSLRLGPGSEGYNRLSIAKLRELGRIGEGDASTPRETIAGTWLLSAQVDVIAPMDDAVPVRAFLQGSAPQTIGRKTSLAPRVGLEHETLPGRLRTRLGAFLEPSPFADQLHRVHATGGFELFLFRYIEDWSLSASFDFAARYSDVGISIGLWR